MLDRLGELSDQELQELEDSILNEFGSLEDGDVTAQSVDAMTQLADALDAVRTESNGRVEQAAELSRRHDELLTRVKGEPEAEAGEPDGAPAEAEAAVTDGDLEDAEVAAADEAPETHAFVDDDGDGVCDVCGAAADDPVHVVAASAVAEAEAPAEAELSVIEAEAPEAEVAVEAEVSVEAEAEETSETETEAAVSAEVVEATEASAETGEDQSEESVTASATPEANEPVVTAPADRQPVARVTASVAITAGADIPGVSAGSPLENMTAVAKAMTDRLHQMRRTSGGDGEQHTVASLIASFPEERTLRSNDPDGNSSKIESVVSPQAITAAGGLCAPVNVRYDLFGLGELGRPVKDALAPFNADRGGIRFITPPTLADLSGSVSLWTVQDDIDAATVGAPDPVKPCLRVACGSEVTVLSDAIPLCLTFGNMGARAYPEMVARNNELGLIQHARFAETRLLTRIGALSTAVTGTKKIGATADFFANVDRASAAYRNRHRMDANAPLRVILPEWFKNLIRADLAYRMPGDTPDASFAIVDAMIANYFKVRSINVTYAMDGETGQVFGAQSAGSLLDFPGTVIWYLFAEGTFLFLDGGTLDLGLVRDSTLNGTNDYKMFVETFEGVAKVGIESLRITSTLEPSGMVAGTVDLSAGVVA